MIDKQMAERKALNERMTELVKKRDALRRRAAEEARRPRPADSFDHAVQDTLRAQIKR